MRTIIRDENFVFQTIKIVQYIFVNKNKRCDTAG